MSLLAVAGANSVSGGYDIDNSLKTEGTNTEYLYRTLGTPTDLKKVTISFWIKRTELGRYWSWGTSQETTGDLSVFRIFFEPDDQISFQDYDTTNNYRVITSRYFRDTSAWYHIVGVVDTTNATADDRMKLYINGVQETNFHTRSNFALNHEVDLQSGKVLNIARYVDNGATTYAERGAYLADWIYVDGQALEPTDFGEFDTDTGIWKPKNYTGTYGNNGYRLKFDNASNLGEDSSGNSNNFTLSNITSVDQATDTPTNNFATWNVIADTRLNNDSDRLYFNEGGTQPIKSFGTGWNTVVSTQAFSSGKWYWEGEVERQDGTTMWGCFPTKTREVNTYLNSYIGGSESSGFDSGCAFYDNDDAYYHDNTSTACTISGGTVQTVAGDIIMIAVDMDNNKFYAGRNGQWFNSSDNTHANATGITLSDEEHFFAFAAYAPSRTYKTNLGGYTTISISSAASDANGYGNFEYAPPSGYYALCTKNLAEYGG